MKYLRDYQTYEDMTGAEVHVPGVNHVDGQSTTYYDGEPIDMTNPYGCKDWDRNWNFIRPEGWPDIDEIWDASEGSEDIHKAEWRVG